MANMVRALAEEASVPVMLHLDHGDSLERTVACMRAGYSSVMFDGEAYPLDDNIARTAQVVHFAHAAGVSVEAAAGSFGGGEGGDDDIHLTEPDVAARLMSESGADMVAVSVGSMHGQSSQLDIAKLADIAAAVKKPLVLHGGTGIPAEDIAAALEHGIVKVNIGAGLQRAVLRTWKHEQPSHYAGYKAAYEALVEVATEKIRIMHASGKI
jgi:fructose-bisphosphate aldolase class II